MNKPYFKIILCLGVSFCVGNVFSHWFTSEKARIDYEISRLTEDYKEYAQKEPSIENLLSTITSQNNTGRYSIVEITSALKLLGYRNNSRPEVIEAIVDCYNSTNNIWLAKVICVQTLDVLDEALGNALANELMHDPAQELGAKIMMANFLLYRGYNVDETIILEGLASSDLYLRMRATNVYDRLYKKGIYNTESVGNSNAVVGTTAGATNHFEAVNERTSLDVDEPVKNLPSEERISIERGDDDTGKDIDLLRIIAALSLIAVLVIYLIKKERRRGKGSE